VSVYISKGPKYDAKRGVLLLSVDFNLKGEFTLRPSRKSYFNESSIKLVSTSCGVGITFRSGEFEIFLPREY
jgi:hypothetical protein